MQKLTRIHLKMYLTLLRKPGYVVSELYLNSIHQVRKESTQNNIYFMKLKKAYGLNETFGKKLKWNMKFDQYFWQNNTSWICRLSVVLFWCSSCAHSVFLKFFETMEGNLKMWSKCIIHFNFLEKFSFTSFQTLTNQKIEATSS